MATGKKNFDAKRGDTFRKVCTWTVKASGLPVDLSGSVVSGKIKPQLGEGLDLTCELIDAAAGKFKFELSPLETETLTPGVYLYEVQFAYSNGDVETVLAGNIVVTEQVA